MPNDARARNSSLYAVIAEEKKRKNEKKSDGTLGAAK